MSQTPQKRSSGFDPEVFFIKSVMPDGVSPSFTCRTCQKALKSEQPYNLKRHILTAHPVIASSSGLVPEVRNLGDEPPVKTCRITVKMDSNRFRINMVRWATECNLPLNFFSKECVRDILGPMEDGLQIQRTNRQQIPVYAEVVQKRIEKFITDEAKGRLVCIKADLASRKGRSVLGVNAQYVKDGRIIVRTLGMIERFDRNTGQRLSEEVLDILKRFSISIPNVYSFTMDNGSNFLKAGSILRKEQELSVYDPEPDEATSSSVADPNSSKCLDDR